MKKIVRRFLQGCSLTAAMFVFQACYGTEPDMGELLHITFQVVDKDNNAIDGVSLNTMWETRNSNGDLTSHSGWALQGITEDNGVVHAHVYDKECPFTIFQFADEQSRFEILDTTFVSLPTTDTVKVTLKKIANE